MYLYSCEIASFMSFRETDTLYFHPGFNVIVGKNAAGKTALLRVLSLAMENRPHRSIITLPDGSDKDAPPSSATVTFALQKQEIAQKLGYYSGTFYLPRMNVFDNRKARHLIMRNRGSSENG